MSLPRPIQGYHPRADLIWPNSPFKSRRNIFQLNGNLSFFNFFDYMYFTIGRFFCKTHSNEHRSEGC